MNTTSATITTLEQDNYFMGEALKLARFAFSSNEVPVGAVLVFEDQIIGRGSNCPITTSDATAHAEIMALREAAKFFKNYRLPKTTLYVTLEPCIMCIGAMLHARIERLVFGAKDPKTGAICSVFNLLDNKNHNHVITYKSGILEPDCSELLTKFFKNKRNS